MGQSEWENFSAVVEVVLVEVVEWRVTLVRTASTPGKWKYIYDI